MHEDLGIKDVTWLTPDGRGHDARGTGTIANTRCFGLLLDGSAPASSIPRPGTDASVLLVFNAWHEPLEFILPPPADEGQWQRLFDTSLSEQAGASFSAGDQLKVEGRSVIALAAANAGQPADWLNQMIERLPS